MYDVVIIGGGVVGACIARRLCRYNLRIAVLEAENDVAMGATKANSAIVHGGYAESFSTLRGRLCFQGREAFAELNDQLDFGFKPIGSLVIATNDEQLKELERLLHNGLKNGLEDLEILNREQVRKIEPNIHPDVTYALHCKGAGVCSPYGLTIAMMENAIQNGVDLFLNSKVIGIHKMANGFLTTTEKGDQIRSRYIVNAAGYHANEVGELIGVKSPSVHPRSGAYIVFEAGTGEQVKHVVFQTPSHLGKGILVTPTVYGNLMIGPDAIDEEEPNLTTTAERLYNIYEQALRSIPDIDINKFLKSFAGVRPVPENGDFFIEESTDVPHFIQVSGIQSPGLTSAPAIAYRVTGILVDAGLELKVDPTYNPYRKRVTKIEHPKLAGAEVAEKVSLPLGDPNRLVCRCEQVSEKVMRKALARPIPFTTVDGMKRRTRSSMGYCQGQFCRPRTIELMEEVLGKPIDPLNDADRHGYHRATKEQMLKYIEKVNSNK